MGEVFSALRFELRDEMLFKVFDDKTALKTAVYRTGSGLEKPPQVW
jgi:hypothetical protein